MYITKHDTLERLMKDKHNVSVVMAVANKLIRMKFVWSKIDNDCIEIYKVDENDNHDLRYTVIGRYYVSDHIIKNWRIPRFRAENLVSYYSAMNELFNYCWDNSIDECQYDVMIIGQSRYKK